MPQIDDARVMELFQKATAGLLYPSETDAPMEPFCWPDRGGGSANDQIAARAPRGAKIEHVPVASFFSELDASDDAEKFHRLRGVLESNLAGLSVFRVGARRIDVYLIGRTPANSWAGLHTVSVET
jgi:hypothetical protein